MLRFTVCDSTDHADIWPKWWVRGTLIYLRKSVKVTIVVVFIVLNFMTPSCSVRFEVKILENENLKTKLKCFGICHRPDNIRDPLTKYELTAVKNLKKNDDIVIKRPDKGDGVIVLNKTEYESKLKNLIRDDSKFTKCSPNQINPLSIVLEST